MERLLTDLRECVNVKLNLWSRDQIVKEGHQYDLIIELLDPPQDLVSQMNLQLVVLDYVQLV